VPRKYALFFHRLSILERATDHGCIKNCNHPKEMWVGLKCNGLVIFSQRGGIFKILHMRFPLSPPPPTGVFSPKKGDLSNVTGVAGIFDGSEPWENLNNKGAEWYWLSWF
jgi:hypothetical protein